MPETQSTKQEPSSLPITSLKGSLRTISSQDSTTEAALLGREEHTPPGTLSGRLGRDSMSSKTHKKVLRAFMLCWEWLYTFYNLSL